MNTALSVALWVSVTVCVIGIGLVSSWLLLDWQREVQQARAATRMARDYGGTKAAEGGGLQEVDEFTWPIVAQQPPVFYGKAITIPIPRSVLDIELPARRAECEEPTDVQWPVVDIDQMATASGAHFKTDVFPVIYDEWSSKAS
jgi:hypothetical protein